MLYIGPNDNSNGHLIYKLSTDQIIVTMKYQSVPVPEDLIKAINETDPCDNKIQVDHFNSNHSIVQDDYSNNSKDDGRTHFNDGDNSEDESYDELDCSQHLNGVEPNRIVNQENQILITMRSKKSTDVSVKHTGTTSTSTFLQGLFLQYLHKAVVTILYLQPSLPMSIHEDILRHLYKGIYMVVHLLLFLLASLRSKVLQSSLLLSLQSKFLQSSLRVSLQSGFLRSSPLESLQNKFLWSILLVSLWNIFLRRLYKDISMIPPIPLKPEIYIQGIHSKLEIVLPNIRGFVIVPKQVKPEAPKSWLPARSLLQPYAKFFYKFDTYCMFDYNYNIDIQNIRKQVARYVISLKRKQRAKLKAKKYAKSHYHCIFNHILESSSNLVQSNTQKGFCILDTTDYNYKLMSVLRQEDDSTATKGTWFNKEVCDTFLCSGMILQALVDYTDIGRAIGYILDEVYAPSVSMRDSIGSTISFFYTSMVLHPGSDNYLRIHKFIHEGLSSSSLKKQQNEKFTLNNIVLGINYKLTINMLMKKLYIIVQYFYITNRLILEKISRAIYISFYIFQQ